MSEDNIVWEGLETWRATRVGEGLRRVRFKVLGLRTIGNTTTDVQTYASSNSRVAETRKLSHKKSLTSANSFSFYCVPSARLCDCVLSVNHEIQLACAERTRTRSAR